MCARQQVGAEVQQLVALLTQYNRMVERVWDNNPVPQAKLDALARHLESAHTVHAAATEYIGPIHDGTAPLSMF
jgi:hypothetical protein